MTTLLVEPDELAAAELEVDGAAHRHLFRARRLAVGERLRLVDGRGRARWATVERVGRGRALLVAEEPAPAREPALRVELLAAPPRPQRAAWLVEKATELGAVAVRFVAFGRSVRTFRAGTLARLGRVARAAVEQCERSWLPEVTGVHPWREVEELLAPAAARWLLDPAGGAAAARVGGGTLAVVVGPEGGFTEEERGRLVAAGCTALAVGPTTLRVETAALAGLALALAAPTPP